MDSQPTIAEFFRGRHVFITGGLGFLGKVLVEKLLRSCPDIGTLYLIIREKKGRDPAQRLKKCFDLPVFDRIKAENPSSLEKVIVIPGDMMSLGLAISPEHRRLLEENVSVVFHAAATIRFDDPIKSAVLMNVRGTRETLDLAADMKQLKAFVHVSTTYCNTDRKEIGEQIYPAHGDWRAMIRAVDIFEESTLNALTNKLIGVMPNTYTYTKGMAEQMVMEYRENLPVLIYRPSIVVGAYEEPMPGWIDNFNGPVGLFAAGGKGIMRQIYANPDVHADYMAVDIAIKAMVVAAWLEGTTPKSAELPLYNASSGHYHKISTQKLVDMSAELLEDFPLTTVLWHPRQRVTTSFVDYYFSFLLTQMLPALMVDLGLYLSGRKPMLSKIQRHIYVANVALEYFLLREWDFKNDKFIALLESGLPEDKEAWCVEPTEVELYDFMRKNFAGGRKYLLREPDSSIPRAKVIHFRMLWLDRVARGVFYTGIFWFVYSHNILQSMLSRVGDNLGSLLAADLDQ